MRTRSMTTYILLDKGTEDEKLFHEILAVISRLGMSAKEMITNYPMLYELKQGLEKEVEV